MLLYFRMTPRQQPVNEAKKEAGNFQPLFWVDLSGLPAAISVVATQPFHKRVWLRLELAPHIRIFSQKSLQLVMIVDKLSIP